jgi:hypothetical protein
MRQRDVAVLGASIAAVRVVPGGYFRYLHVDTASIAALSRA